MTTLNVTLSAEDEKILGSIIKSNYGITTLEEALLWCLHNYTMIQLSQKMLSSLYGMKKEQMIQVLNITNAVRTISYIPDIPTRPSPAAITEKILLLTGETSNIDNLINLMQREMPKNTLNMFDLENKD